MRIWRKLLSIAVHTAQQEIDTEVGHQYCQEGHGHIEMEPARTVKPGYGLGVQGNAVDEHRDECPYLFRVPSPVAAPRLVGPDGTDEDAGCETEDGGVE